MSNCDLYQELRLVRIREYELPTLKRAVIIQVPAEIEKTQKMVHQGLEFFSYNMNQDSNNKLSETKLLQHQNTFQNMEKGQVVNLKIFKTQPSKNQVINNIETTPIELEKKCMSLKKKKILQWNSSKN
ncbi:unnamed protein product [Aphis gossypii]|uniref:Uncharacterized protein n=1 Tax=Aphis gossypii TaxID=80765 RepID=A0A9P0J3D8_APHGO|nr:unnamed protein product [Aphis gossypii]